MLVPPCGDGGWCGDCQVCQVKFDQRLRVRLRSDVGSNRHFFTYGAMSFLLENRKSSVPIFNQLSTFYTGGFLHRKRWKLPNFLPSQGPSPAAAGCASWSAGPSERCWPIWPRPPRRKPSGDDAEKTAWIPWILGFRVNMSRETLGNYGNYHELPQFWIVLMINDWIMWFFSRRIVGILGNNGNNVSLTDPLPAPKKMAMIWRKIWPPHYQMTICSKIPQKNPHFRNH